MIQLKSTQVSKYNMKNGRNTDSCLRKKCIGGRMENAEKQGTERIRSKIKYFGIYYLLRIYDLYADNACHNMYMILENVLHKNRPEKTETKKRRQNKEVVKK